jgi:hypothetical protein
MCASALLVDIWSCLGGCSRIRVCLVFCVVFIVAGNFVGNFMNDDARKHEREDSRLL